MRPVFAYCFLLRDRERGTERQLERQRRKQTVEEADRQRDGQTVEEADRRVCVQLLSASAKRSWTWRLKRQCAVAALHARQSQNEATTHTHTYSLSHTHTSIQLKRKHNKKWRAYKIFRAFLFRIKIRTHTHAHSLCSAWLRSRACLGALFAANSLARCALSLAVSRSFEIRIKYWVRMSFVADCNVTKKVTTATNTHGEQHTHTHTPFTIIYVSAVWCAPLPNFSIT